MKACAPPNPPPSPSHRSHSLITLTISNSHIFICSRLYLQGPVGAALLFLAAALLFISATDALKIGETCSADSNCDTGLNCDACGTDPKICTRIKPTDPQSKGKGLPFNKYSWLTTHNSYALMSQAQKSGLISPTNQQDTVTDQLNNGVRGLMLDMYDFQSDIWLCHSFGGKCYNFTAFQPAINVLKEIQVFLEANQTEIITIFIEDYVTSPMGLTKVFDAAGLRKYWFPLASMPKNGSDWPLISDMISKNQRLIVFTSKSAKEATESIAYEWNYIVENQYGDGGMKTGSCPSRAESASMNTTTRSLVLMNYFPDVPDISKTCTYNSAPLVDMLKTCEAASAKRWPNFIAVDFYKKSVGGGAPLATDTANGYLVCGCDNIAYCKDNSTFGTCVDPPPAPPSPPSRSLNGGGQSTSGASLAGRQLTWWWSVQSVSMAIVLLLS